MAKLLKLTGITTYTGKATPGVQIKKGETALFSDNVAEKVLRGSKVDKEGSRVPYFTVVQGVDVTHNFTGKPIQPPVNAFVAQSSDLSQDSKDSDDETTGDAAEVTEDAPAPAARKTQRRTAK